MALDRDIRALQSEWDTEAAHFRIRWLRAIARRDPVLARMIAEDLRWMPGVFGLGVALTIIAAVMAP